MKCAVWNCKNTNVRTTKGISFFSFPSDKTLRKKWLKFCRRPEEFITRTASICMEHFRPEDVENNLKYEMGFSAKRILKKGVVPSIPCEQENSETEERANRELKRTYKKIVSDLLKESEEQLIDEDSNCGSDPCESSQENPATEAKRLKMEDAEPLVFVSSAENEELQEEISCLKSEITSLREENETLYRKQAQHEVELNELKQNVVSLAKRVAKAEFLNDTMENALSKFLTDGQIKKLRKNGKRVVWSEDDIAQSIELYSTSVKAYMLLYRKGYPIPAVRTLQQWAQVYNMKANIVDVDESDESDEEI